ncbi:hypothetical protein R6Q59_029409 [Mikania micrantha]
MTRHTPQSPWLFQMMLLMGSSYVRQLSSCGVLWLKGLKEIKTCERVARTCKAFKHIKGESLEAQLNRFTHLMTEMTSAGIEMSKGEVNKKLLNSLPYNWNSNCTTIKRTKDMYKTSLSELISIINSYDMDHKQRSFKHASSMGITLASENDALLSATNFQAFGLQHDQAPSSQSVPFETAFLSSEQVSSVPKISSESEENLLLFKGFLNIYNALIAGKLEPANLTQENLEQINPADFEEMDISWKMTMSGHFARHCKQPKVAKEGEKKPDENLAAGGGPSTSKALVTQETDSYDWSDQVQERELTLSHAFMAEVDEKQNEEYKGHSTITKEAGSKLNPNCEPFVPIESLEHASTSSSTCHSDSDVKPFDPKEFHEKKNLKVKVIRTNNGTEFKNQTLIDFCDEKGIARQYSAVRTPQQNGVAERRNRTLIEVARTMLSKSKLPIFLLAEAVNTACYADECYFVGYSLEKAAYRVYNKKIRMIVETYYIDWQEMNNTDVGSGPNWLFQYDSIFKPFNTTSERTGPSEPTDNLYNDHIPEEHCVDHEAEASETALVDNISSSSEDQMNHISNLLDNLAAKEVPTLSTNKNHPVENIIGPLSEGVLTRSRSIPAQNTLPESTLTRRRTDVVSEAQSVESGSIAQREASNWNQVRLKKQKG